MSRTFRRPPIKQHKDLLVDGRYASRVEKNKKKNKTNKKYPRRALYEDLNDENNFGGT